MTVTSCRTPVASTVEELQAWIDERCGCNTRLWLKWMAEAEDGHVRRVSLPPPTYRENAPDSPDAS